MRGAAGRSAGHEAVGRAVVERLRVGRLFQPARAEHGNPLPRLMAPTGRA